MMKGERCSHCDGVRFTFKVENDLKKAHKVFRVDPAVDQVISVNRYGFPTLVGNGIVHCRPFAPPNSKTCTHLTLDFNPGKVCGFYGLCDERHPFDAIVKSSLKTLKVLEIPFDATVKDAIRRGNGTVSRMHLTLHFFAPDVTAVLEQIKQELKDRGIKFSSEGHGATVYVNKVDGKESRHWVLVIYDKCRELVNNRPRGISDEEYQRILELAKGVVRVELRLNSKILPRLKLRFLYCWRDIDVDALVFRYLDRLGLRSVRRPALTKEEQAALTMTEQRDYELWLRGGQLKEKMSPQTFQKRAARFKDLGVDIKGRYRPPHEESIDLGEVFARANLVPSTYW